MTETVLGGRYRLTSPIAAGGMGEVWRADDELLGREVAIKLLGRHVAGDATFRDRFRSEARITAALTDPGIAQVFDYGESDGLAYLVMELVRGEPLSAILARNGVLGPDVTLDLVEQTARGLHAAHRAGVIHRDVKPGNLLVTETGQVKITDFGIARALEAAPLTATGTILGTAQYVSPEQASGATLSPASDVYSLGVVAYECLAGRPPFTAETPVALALRHLNDTPPPLPGNVPAPVAALVMAMLAKDPAARPETGPVLLDRVRVLRETLAGTAASTALLGSLTDPGGFPAAGGAGRTVPPAAPGLTTPLGEPAGAGTPRPGATAPLGPAPAAPRTAPAGVPDARTRRPGGPEGPAGGRRRRTALILATAGCAAAVGIGVLAFTAAHTGESPPDPGETAAPVSPSPSPSPSPSSARTNRSEVPRTHRPTAPAASDEPSAVPSATVSRSASTTQTPTPASSPTSTPTPTSTPATETSETPPPTDAPPDTNPPDEGE
ncbi:serine/threonine-protein kinase [Microbispora sp. KK1-11]|uniref:serine/threonine-protein kinase n=1 Tax=Microbispora sp. KK1-11 TaxID=2053005 RepID=UPI0021AF7E31|nr:serine/threonine-protein kinase [Microbispora sp. KK1-11]